MALGYDQLDQLQFQQKQDELEFQSWKQRQDYLNSGATQYLSEWKASLNRAGDVYNQALDTLNGAENNVNALSSIANQMGSLANDISDDFEGFNQRYTPMEDAAISDFHDSMADRNQLRDSYMQLVPEDIDEASGIAGRRAMNDVGYQEEMNRRGFSRELASMGIDPGSGAAMGLNSRARTQSGLNQVLAGNQARNMEKTRLADIVSNGLQLINPYESSAAAMSINSQRVAGRQNQANALGAAGSMHNAAISGANSIASGKTNIAGNMAQLGNSYASMSKMTTG